MKILKGFALVVLSLLLFLSLSVFGIAYTLNSTLLNPDFVVDEVEKLDISSIAGDLLAEQIGENLPEEARFLEGTVSTIVSEIISAQEPWIKEQAGAAIHSGYDFLLGKSETLALTISLESLKEDLGASLRESMKPLIMASLPPELAKAPQALIDQYVDEFYEQFAGEIPSEIDIDESFIPPEAMVQIIQARQIIGYFQTGYYGLIGLMILLLLVVVLIGRRLRCIALTLGITFLLYGAIQYAAVFFGKDISLMYLPLHEVPSAVQTWLLSAVDDFIKPLEVFSLGVLAGGIVLLVVSFFVKPGESAE
ncbi:hypothetical protein ACFLUB_00455 [Chloroflexota bacterium]